MQQVDELKAGNDNQNGSAGESSRVMFLPEQQAKVQELIDEAYRKAYAKASKGKSPSEEVERLRGEVEDLKQDKKMAAILKAVSRHSVVDAGEVAELLKGRVKIDEGGSLMVTGETGAVKVSSAGTPMSVDEYVANWLSERPHHLRSTGSTGSGSQSSRFSVNGGRYNLSDPASWRSMPREELDRLLKEGVDVQGTAGQNYRFKDVKNPFIEARKRKFQQSV